VPITHDDVRLLSSKLTLGDDHKAQERAVRIALTSLLVEDRKGVVLADEVGFGKTYEALSAMALLCEHARAARKSFDRVLILCKPALLGKWREELSHVRPDKGFPQYLTGKAWPDGHPVFRLIDAPHIVSHRQSADEYRSIRDGGKLQAPHGLYIVNHRVLSETNRNSRFFLRRLYETEWDLVIVDEAHHYARGTQPTTIFAPDWDLTNYDQGLSYQKILALTATPFELTAQEMVQLLALIRADKGDLEKIKAGLDLYVQQLDGFFGLRERSVTDPLRHEAVRKLRQLRDDDALGQGAQNAGLQALLRRYLIRNTKSQNERRYFFVNRTAGTFGMQPFEKFDDLRRVVKVAPLLPFEGPDALFYLQLRELIDEKEKQARDGNGHRTFVTMDLRQGLSSYPQIASSKLLTHDLGSAKRLKGLVDAWSKPETLRLHPKVEALADLVEAIALAEIDKVRNNPASWFSKILVFNKMVGGTAPHLRDVLTKRLDAVFARRLDAVLQETRADSQASLASTIRERMRVLLSKARDDMRQVWDGAPLAVPDTFQNEDLKAYRGKHLVDAFEVRLLRRTEQPLFLLRALNRCRTLDAEAIDGWLRSEVIGPFEEAIRQIMISYLAPSTVDDRSSEERLEMAESECVVLLQECSALEIVGRYDGENARDREAHRRNFNQLFNPFVLLVSRVGEEGIDLQKQCRYIIHYDLEWNPAKMEQREGRVDRVGWGRSGEGYIDVRFMLLKGTYEERIFHTVMQRDQWFQVLIGAKRNELGKADDDEAANKPGDIDDGPVTIDDGGGGRLAPEEKAAIMMDLRPR
jgi:SNF2 family DNA or RNA helicase